MAGGYEWELSAFIIGVFLQLLGLPFVAVSQVSLFSKVTAEKTQGWFRFTHWLSIKKKQRSCLAYVSQSHICEVCGMCCL